MGQLQRLPQELAKLDRSDLLILDDLSYVRRDQAETSVLFELISERYERKSLAITANTPFSHWGEVFVEPAMTLAAVDRLVHHSTARRGQAICPQGKPVDSPFGVHGLPTAPAALCLRPDAPRLPNSHFLKEIEYRTTRNFKSPIHSPPSTGQDGCRRAARVVDASQAEYLRVLSHPGWCKHLLHQSLLSGDDEQARRQLATVPAIRLHGSAPTASVLLTGELGLLGS